MTETWNQLNQQAVQLMQEGRYQEALEPALAAVAAARNIAANQAARPMPSKPERHWPSP